MIEIEAERTAHLEDGAPCLHCLLTEFVQSYWMAFGIKDEATGKVGIDVPYTLAKMVEVMANMVLRVDGCALQEQLISDIHQMVDGFWIALSTGKEIEITIGSNGKVH